MQVLRQYFAPAGEQTTSGGAGGPAPIPAGGSGGAGGSAAVQGGADTTGGGQSTTSGGSDTLSGGQDTTAGAGATTWRDEIIAGNDKLRSRVERYASPKALAESLFHLQDRIARGEMKTVLPKDATPAQVTQWRAENGIPSDPAKYELKLPDGMVIGDDDKPLVSKFLADVHKLDANLNNAQASAVLAAYYENQEAMTAAQVEKDKAALQTTQDALNAEYGQDYRGNMNRMQSLLDIAPPGVKDKVLGGRTAEGLPITGDADVVRWLVGLAREINPVTSNVPDGQGGGMAGSIEAEIKTIEDRMRSDRKGYDKDEAMQARYRDLITAREKTRQKAA